MIFFKNTFFLSIIILIASCSSLQEKIIKDDKGNITKKYFIDSKTGSKEGLYTEYFDNQNKSDEGEYLNDKLQGQRKIYNYDDESISVVENYQNGMLNGEYLVYFSTNKLKQRGFYKDDVTIGEWEAYYENGQLKEKVTMVDNNENGPFVEYYENGNLKAEGNYLDGDNEDGILKLYNEKGLLIKKMDCVKRRCKTTWSIEDESGAHEKQ